MLTGVVMLVLHTIGMYTLCRCIVFLNKTRLVPRTQGIDRLVGSQETDFVFTIDTKYYMYNSSNVMTQLKLAGKARYSQVTTGVDFALIWKGILSRELAKHKPKEARNFIRLSANLINEMF